MIRNAVEITYRALPYIAAAWAISFVAILFPGLRTDSVLDAFLVLGALFFGWSAMALLLVFASAALAAATGAAHARRV